MPNHIVNVITVNAAPERTAEIMTVLSALDFSEIIPRPLSLDITDGVEAGIARGDFGAGAGDARVNPEILAACRSNLEIHGAATWYDWSIEHWGTKWSAYSVEARPPNVVKFQTAWNAPVPIFAALAARFRDAEFVIEYADEDIGSNQGTLVYRDGCLAERRTLPGDYKSRDRRMFAYRLHGYSAEDIAERESERD